MVELAPPLEALLALPDSRRWIGPFQLIRQLGRGGFAPVWLAREVHGETDLRTAAVKLFSLDVPGEPSASTKQYAARIIEEARTLCQVEHPWIVRFYALPTDEGHTVMGLAMEYVAGTSVDRLVAEKGKLPVEQAAAIGAMVASALSAVHRAGLVHRDVKPANVVEAGGVYKLIDFGIAAAELPGPASNREPQVIVMDDLPLEVPGSKAGIPPARTWSSHHTLPSMGSRRGAAGTIGYIAPECFVVGSRASPASDIYSLGVLLFECLTGRLPASYTLPAGRGLDGAALEGRTRSPSLLDVAPGVPAPLARLIDAMLSPAAHKRPRSAEWVASELDRIRSALAGNRRVLPVETTGPFRGLARFEEADRDVYFGRDSEVAAGLDMLRTRGLVALVGPSGSGKSSLARAGLVPRVAEGALGGWPKRWDVAIATPGADPRAAVGAALSAIRPPVPDADRLAPGELAEVLTERAFATERGLVLLVDQLEELVTTSSGLARDWTIELLSLLGERVLPGTRVLVTVRRDLLDPILAKDRLGKAIIRGTSLVVPMADSAWGDVIDQALSVYGYTFEDERLRAEVTEELRGTSSAMPLVQFALTELWHKRDVARKQITRAGLSAIGGIAGALERHADDALSRIDQAHPNGAAIARSVLLALTTPRGTRARVDVTELSRAGGEGAASVIEALERARLVVREPEGVTLAHEALLAQWGTLRSWIDEVRQDRLLAEEIERDAGRWKTDDTAPVPRKRRLAAADELLRRGLVAVSPEAFEFVSAGRRAERRAHLAVAALLAIAVAIGVSFVVLYTQGVRAEKAEADEARAQAEQSLRLAEQKTKELVAAQARNDELLEKLADAPDDATILALQAQVKEARDAAAARPRASPEGAPAAAAARVPPPPAPPDTGLAAPPPPATIKVQTTWKP